MARVPVVVASQNRRTALLQSLPWHLALPERPPAIVVDNASTDGTGAALARAHQDVQLIRLGRNAGAAARNVGRLLDEQQLQSRSRRYVDQ